MPTKLVWTAPADARLRRMRAEGATWDRIAAALGLSRYTVIERGRRIGATRPPQIPLAADETAFLQDRRREPLRAGHPVAWALLTDGTSLEGSRYVWTAATSS